MILVEHVWTTQSIVVLTSYPNSWWSSLWYAIQFIRIVVCRYHLDESRPFEVVQACNDDGNCLPMPAFSLKKFLSFYQPSGRIVEIHVCQKSEWSEFDCWKWGTFASSCHVWHLDFDWSQEKVGIIFSFQGMAVQFDWCQILRNESP